MPIAGKSLSIIEVQAYELYFVQQNIKYHVYGNGPTFTSPLVDGSNILNYLKIENALQRGTETSCTTTQARAGFKPHFKLNF
jgi:hypothetical protein